MEEAQEILSDGSDPEMVDWQKMAVRRTKTAIPKLEERKSRCFNPQKIQKTLRMCS